MLATFAVFMNFSPVGGVVGYDSENPATCGHLLRKPSEISRRTLGGGFAYHVI